MKAEKELHRAGTALLGGEVATTARRRAAPMAPDERRLAIASATVSLLLEHGPNVSTRQIADSAGIAEGTIFRVFPDKDAVLRAAVELALDTAATEQALAAIDRKLSFEHQLEDAVEIMQQRLSDLWRLLSTVPEAALRDLKPAPAADLLALVDLFEPQRTRLRIDPSRAARQLRALTLGVSHPALYADGPMSAAEIVTLLLDGIRAPRRRANSAQGHPC